MADVMDSSGLKMNVSAIVKYKIIDPIKALYNVENHHSFITNESLEVTGLVCARFSADGAGKFNKKEEGG